jgi:hypothetical protein
MRPLMAVPALLLAAFALGGCNTGAPAGVLPRDPVPPPPSMAGDAPRRAAPGARTDAAAQRRSLAVPAGRPAPPRP